MKIYEEVTVKELVQDDRLWGGAKDTINYLKRVGKLEEGEQLAEQILSEYSEGFTIYEVNNFIWLELIDDMCKYGYLE